MPGVRTVSDLEQALFAELQLAQRFGGPPPNLAGRYEVLRLLGRGARGLVVEARDGELSRAVALKLFPPVEDARLDREIRREAQALAQLEHPNVVRVFDAGAGVLSADGLRLEVRYISMELVRGSGLRVWRDAAPRPRSEVLRVLEEAARGLAAAHAKGIVHRDFKPENVMIDEQGRARVVDFGLAKGAGRAAASGAYRPGDELGTTFTATGAIVGTLAYLAPEALEGAPTEASDQYAFAVVAWEILAGTHPFPGRAAGGPSSGESSAEPVASAKIPGALRPVLRRALAPRPSDRFEDMEALLSAWRGRLRRRRLVPWAAAGALALAGGSLALGRAQGPSVPPALSVAAESDGRAASGVGDSPPTDPCAAIAGVWHARTVVVWSDDVKFVGVNGLYEFDLSPLGGCRFELRARKTGSTRGASTLRYPEPSVRTGTAVVTAEEAGGALRIVADVGMAAPKVPKAIYRFDLSFDRDGRGFVGAYAYRSRKTAPPRHMGAIRGRRDPLVERVAAVWDDLPCSVACGFVCPDEVAADRCRRRCHGAGLTECGAPTEAFVPPQRLTEAFDGEPERATCARVGRRVAGVWEVHAPGEAPRRVVVRPSGCQLDVFAGGFDGGEIGARGAWRLLRGDRAALTLVGTGPAFGFDDRGRGVAAYRVPTASAVSRSGRPEGDPGGGTP